MRQWRWQDFQQTFPLYVRKEWPHVWGETVFFCHHRAQALGPVLKGPKLIAENKAKSRTTTLEFRTAVFGLFKDLLWGTAYDTQLEKREAQECCLICTPLKALCVLLLRCFHREGCRIWEMWITFSLVHTEADKSQERLWADTPKVVSSPGVCMLCLWNAKGSWRN